MKNNIKKLSNLTPDISGVLEYSIRPCFVENRNNASWDTLCACTAGALFTKQVLLSDE